MYGFCNQCTEQRNPLWHTHMSHNVHSSKMSSSGAVAGVAPIPLAERHLKAFPLPDVQSNCVHVSPDEFTRLYAVASERHPVGRGLFCLIHRRIYMLAPHTDVPDGHVGLTQLQQKDIPTTTESINLTLANLPASPPVEMWIEFPDMPQRKEFFKRDIISHVTKELGGHYVCNGSQLKTVFCGHHIVVRFLMPPNATCQLNASTTLKLYEPSLNSMRGIQWL